MRVFISIDLEGVAGVATADQILRGRDDFPAARRLMTAEANAAVAGAFAGGATAVTVNDAHGDMANLLPELMDRRAELVYGSPKLPHGMMQGMDGGFDVALFIGYHAGAGVEDGVLSHTFTGAFSDVRLNGQSMTETELNAHLAATMGVPVALVTGDESICRLIEKLMPGTLTLSVKTGQSYTAVASIHPEVACEKIEEAAGEAVRLAATGALVPYAPPTHCSFEIDVTKLRMAELCSLVPGVRRSGRTLTFDTEDYMEGYACIRAFMYLCQAAEALR